MASTIRQHTPELFGQHRHTEWRNRLIWGDKKYVLPSLLLDKMRFVPGAAFSTALDGLRTSG